MIPIDVRSVQCGVLVVLEDNHMRRFGGLLGEHVEGQEKG